MRLSKALIGSVSLLALVACGPMEDAAKGPIDPNTLGPLPARELLAIESGNSSIREGDPRQAEISYRKAAALSKGHVEGHLMLARLLNQQHRTGEAMKVIQEGLSWQPEQPDLNLMLGKQLLAQAHYQEAQRVFENGLIRAPRNIDLLTGKGIAMDMQGDHIGAQLTYNEAITYNTREDSSFVKNNLGLSYLFQNKPKQAVALLEPLAKAENASAVTKHNLALAYALLGEDAKAKTLLGDVYDADTQKEAVANLKSYQAARAKGDEATPPPSLPIQDKQ